MDAAGGDAGARSWRRRGRVGGGHGRVCRRRVRPGCVRARGRKPAGSRERRDVVVGVPRLSATRTRATRGLRFYIAHNKQVAAGAGADACYLNVTISSAAGPWPPLTVQRVFAVFPGHPGVLRSSAIVTEAVPYRVTGADIVSLSLATTPAWPVPRLFHVGQVGCHAARAPTFILIAGLGCSEGTCLCLLGWTQTSRRTGCKWARTHCPRS